MNMQELAQYRIKLIRDASSMTVKPERVPHISFFVTWKILDSGYKLSEAMCDYSIMEKVVREHQERYNFDALMELGNRNQYRLSKALGSSNYVINDEKGSVNYTDETICTHEELAEFSADMKKFLWEKGMSKKYSFWQEPVDISFVQNALNERNRFIDYSIHMANVMKNEYGIPPMFSSSWYVYSGMDFLFNTVRGIKGLAVDMRKNDSLLKDSIDAINEMYFKPNLEKLKAAPDGPNTIGCFDNDITILVQGILSIKQWDTLYWPYLKQIFDVIAEKKMVTRFFTEGSGIRFWDYIKDYPKGTIVLHPENDDVFEIRKQLPNVAIMGGMPLSLLGHGTKKECLDRTKALIDELGFDGGFILTQDKMGSYPSDANRENLSAVCDFVNSYTPSQN